MKTRSLYIIVLKALAIVSLLIAIGCDHKDLCYYHPHVAPVRVNVDWAKANRPDMDGMTAFLFALQEQTQEIKTTETTPNVHSISFELTEGNFRVAIFNSTPSELGTLDFSDITDFDNAAVRVAQTKAPSWYTKYSVKTSDSYISGEPEWIAKGLCDIEVTKEMVDIAEKEYIDNGFSYDARTVNVAGTVVPDSLTRKLNVEIVIAGISNYYSAEAVITGFVIGKKINSGELLNETVSHIISRDYWKVIDTNITYKDSGSIKAAINCFGLPRFEQLQRNANENMITINITLADRQTVMTYGPIPVGNLIIRDTLTNNLFLKLNFEPELPYVTPAEGEGSGFDIGFEDWEKEEIEILNH